jgi:hypothetical protein
MAAASEEQQLIERLRQLSDPAQPAEDVAAGRQAWYAAAAEYLQRRPGIDHWFCKHSEIARGLAEVLRLACDLLPAVNAWRLTCGHGHA